MGLRAKARPYLPQVGATVGALLLAGAGFATDPERWFIFAAGALFTIAGVVVGVRHERRRRAEDENLKVTLFKAFGPLSRSVAMLPAMGARPRRQSIGSTLNAALASALSVSSSDRARATFFERCTVADQDVLRPHPMLSLGRGEAPQSVFRRDTAEGAAVWERALADRETFCEDLIANPPQGLDASKTRAYRTFITVPIFVRNELVGLLTVNAPNKGDLTVDDVGLMRVVASLVGGALTLVDGKWPAHEA